MQHPNSVKTVSQLSLVLLLVGYSCAEAIEPAIADDYPNKPITIIVPFAAGSGLDARIRQVAGLLAPRLGQPVVVDNRPGASGATGTSLVAKAKPDGYTVLACSGSTHAVNPAVVPDLGYDPRKDFSPVVRIVSAPLILAINPNVPAQSVGELIRLAKAKPGQIRYGSGGPASTFHIAGALFAYHAGIELTHVPYKGDGPALTDAIGGHIEMLFSSPILLFPQASAGRLRLLAVAGPRRLPAVPDVPTLQEAGVPGSELIVWAGLCAPAGTPQVAINRLNREVLSAFSAPDLKHQLERDGYEVVPNSPAEFGIFLSEELVRFQKLAKELGIRLEQ